MDTLQIIQREQLEIITIIRHVIESISSSTEVATTGESLPPSKSILKCQDPQYQPHKTRHVNIRYLEFCGTTLEHHLPLHLWTSTLTGKKPRVIRSAKEHQVHVSIIPNYPLQPELRRGRLNKTVQLPLSSLESQPVPAIIIAN